MKEYIEPIKSQLSMRDVLNRYGIETDPHGFAHCPFHQGDRNASLKCYERSYYCFGCGESGDQITFVQKLFGLNFCEVVGKINQDFNMGLPIGKKTTLREQQIYSKRYREFMREREREAQQKREKEKRLSKLWDEWCFCDRALREANPDSLAYAHACHRIDYVSYLIDEEG